MWGSGKLRLATTARHHGEDVLVTHAGMTPGTWDRLGQPSDPHTTADLINEDVGADLSVVSRPGRLVTGPPRPDADTSWAEVNLENYATWLHRGSMPFSQLHGHASPFRWAQDAWWPEAPEGVRRATSVDQATRTSTMYVGQRFLHSVDWVLEEGPIEGSWPLITAG